MRPFNKNSVGLIKGGNMLPYVKYGDLHCDKIRDRK